MLICVCLKLTRLDQKDIFFCPHFNIAQTVRNLICFITVFVWHHFRMLGHETGIQLKLSQTVPTKIYDTN